MTWFKNVKIETKYENNRTKTQVVAIEIKNGKIKQIVDTPPESVEAIDALKYLLLPSLRDNHIHLDKGHFGGPWQAVKPLATVAERIDEERSFLLDFLKQTPERAQALIDLITGFGVTEMRVQVNIDPVVEMKNFKLILDILEKNSEKLNFELVSFPQHGTLASKEQLLESFKRPELAVIGSVDPATIDYDIEASLTFIFENAVKYNKGIDVHLHDMGELGIYEIHRIIDYTKKYDMQGRVEISHVYSLGTASEEVVKKVAKELVKNEITINTTIPIDVPAPPIYELEKYGVRVHIINDNINDHWSPFGSGDLIERASRGAERFSRLDEQSLSQTLKFITRDNLTPISDANEMVWPKVGDAADFLFIDAASSAEVIARIPARRVVTKAGKIVSGEFI